MKLIIPAVVLEEVDSKKRYMDEIGRNATASMQDSLMVLRETGNFMKEFHWKMVGKLELN